MALLNQLLGQDADAESPAAEPGGAILAVDIGSVYTRAILIDMVEGMYRFVARGKTPTTIGEPWNDALVGVYQAIAQISEATGRQIIDESGDLIVPEADEFVGVDAFVATASAGQPLCAVLVGLMPDFSLRSGRRAAESIYLSVAETISLADRRTADQQIDALLAADADLVFVVGGTDGGAEEALRKKLDTIFLAYSLMENQYRPPLLYAGNRALTGMVHERGQELGLRVLTADNVRPTLDTEYLNSAQAHLARLYNEQKSRSTAGIADIVAWTDEGMLPTAHGFGRMVDLLAGLRGRNTLGIDLGSMATTVVASIDGERYLNVFGQLGMGHSARDILDAIRLDNLTRWLSVEPAQPDTILDYVWNKSLFPQTIPTTPEELELEYAVAREVIRYAVLSARQSWRRVPQRGLLPLFGTILLSGTTLTHAPTYGWSILVALDALLPIGYTRVLLDPYGVAAALGALAPRNPQVVVQVLETGAFHDLGAVFSLSGRARQGEVVLRGSLKVEGSNKPEPFEVRYGTIVALPLAPSARAELVLQVRRGEIAGIGRRRRMTVTGGELGLVIDARGRPWRFPRAPGRRQEMVRRWQQAITGKG